MSSNTNNTNNTKTDNQEDDNGMSATNSMTLEDFLSPMAPATNGSANAWDPNSLGAQQVALPFDPQHSTGSVAQAPLNTGYSDPNFDFRSDYQPAVDPLLDSYQFRQNANSIDETAFAGEQTASDAGPRSNHMQAGPFDEPFSSPRTPVAGFQQHDNFFGQQDAVMSSPIAQSPSQSGMVYSPPFDARIPYADIQQHGYAGTQSSPFMGFHGAPARTTGQSQDFFAYGHGQPIAFTNNWLARPTANPEGADAGQFDAPMTGGDNSPSGSDSTRGSNMEGGDQQEQNSIRAPTSSKGKGKAKDKGKQRADDNVVTLPTSNVPRPDVFDDLDEGYDADLQRQNQQESARGGSEFHLEGYEPRIVLEHPIPVTPEDAARLSQGPLAAQLSQRPASLDVAGMAASGASPQNLFHVAQGSHVDDFDQKVPEDVVGGWATGYKCWWGKDALALGWKSAEAAKNYRNRITVPPTLNPAGDQTIDRLEKNRDYCIMMIIWALCHQDRTHDKKSAPQRKPFKRGTDGAFHDHELEALAIEIFDALIERVRLGFRGRNLNDLSSRPQAGLESDRDGNAMWRFRSILDCLATSKCACRDVSQDKSKIRLLVNAPLTYRKHKDRNLANNNAKEEERQKLLVLKRQKLLVLKKQKENEGQSPAPQQGAGRPAQGDDMMGGIQYSNNGEMGAGASAQQPNITNFMPASGPSTSQPFTPSMQMGFGSGSGYTAGPPTTNPAALAATGAAPTGMGPMAVATGGANTPFPPGYSPSPSAFKGAAAAKVTKKTPRTRAKRTPAPNTRGPNNRQGTAPPREGHGVAPPSKPQDPDESEDEDVAFTPMEGNDKGGPEQGGKRRKGPK